MLFICKYIPQHLFCFPFFKFVCLLFASYMSQLRCLIFIYTFYGYLQFPNYNHSSFIFHIFDCQIYYLQVSDKTETFKMGLHLLPCDVVGLSCYCCRVDSGTLVYRLCVFKQPDCTVLECQGHKVNPDNISCICLNTGSARPQ